MEILAPGKILYARQVRCTGAVLFASHMPAFVFPLSSGQVLPTSLALAKNSLSEGELAKLRECGSSLWGKWCPDRRRTFTPLLARPFRETCIGFRYPEGETEMIGQFRGTSTWAEGVRRRSVGTGFGRFGSLPDYGNPKG